MHISIAMREMHTLESNQALAHHYALKDQAQ
jgi:hypothetical protein